MMIAMIKTTLLPFVDLDRMLLNTEIGQDMPKHMSMMISKICIPCSSFCCAIIISLTNTKVKYIISIKIIGFTYNKEGLWIYKS